MKKVQGGVTAAKGFLASGAYCGLRKNPNKKDLALIYSQTPAAAAAVYTENLVKGAPIVVTKKNIADGYCRAIICNSGNANTCNEDGVEIAEKTCAAVASELGIKPEDVAVASTGVIGQRLDVNKIVSAVPALVSDLSPEGGGEAAGAIMTTDLALKECAVSFEVDGKTAVVGGAAKGSGMIKPNMATMLAFVTSDVSIEPSLLQKAVKDAADKSFNSISVDGDTSTNDMFLTMCSGASGVEIKEGGAYDSFFQALLYVCDDLAKKMAKDGEGATKLITCHVCGAKDDEGAAALAKSVIASNLFKAAMFGSDANWGRILCALGYAGVEFDPGRVSVSFSSAAGKIGVCENGVGVDFSEEKATEILSQSEICVHCSVGGGPGKGHAYGCDLTYDYVKINGDYRS